MKDQFLYHGTSAHVLESIQKKGILPRAFNKGAQDNWKHTVSSNRAAVYLTTAYGWHFAAHAGKDKKGLILEIDRLRLPSPFSVCPDEDWLEQTTRKQGPTADCPNLAMTSWGMKQRTLYYRRLAPANPFLAEASLEAMGTAAYYGTIPWTAVSRYVVIDYAKADWVHMQSVDSAIMIMNYKLLENRHRAFTRHLFNDPVTPEEVMGENLFDQLEGEPEALAGFRTMQKKRRDILAELMLKRAGLEVVDLRSDRGPGFERLKEDPRFNSVVDDTRRLQTEALERVADMRQIYSDGDNTHRFPKGRS